MAKFGQQFIRGLLQPSYQQGLFTAAQQLGARPRKIAEEKEKRKRLQGLLTGQEPLTQQDISSFVAAGGDIANIPAAQQLRESYNEPLREKGRGRLRAIAQTELFDPQDPGQLQGYKNVAEKHKLSFNEAMKILAEERGTQIERAKTRATVTGKPSYVDRGEIVDSRGLRYGLSEIRTGEGVKINYEPIGHETDFTDTLPDGKPNPIKYLGGAYKETAAGKSERIIEETKAKAKIDVLEAKGIQDVKNFSDLQDKSMTRLPEVVNGLNDVNTLLEIVTELEQGGSLVALQDKVQKVLGRQETDAGVFNNLAKELLVNRIKAFGANPTEGERAYLEQLIPALENTREINSALLNRMKTRLERERSSINYIIQPDTTRESYVSFVDSLYSTDGVGTSTNTGNKRVRFNDIP